MKRIGEYLNLRGHHVGKDNLLIYGPGDVEIHKGTDGNYFALDLGRFLPPETPEMEKNGRIVDPKAPFYKLLRPELVKSSKNALSSDAYTQFGSRDENEPIYIKDI